MMRFDSATSRFLALLVIKPYQKSEAQNSKEKFPHFAVKKVQNHSLSHEFCHVTHLQDLKIFVGQ